MVNPNSEASAAEPHPESEAGKGAETPQGAALSRGALGSGATPPASKPEEPEEAGVGDIEISPKTAAIVLAVLAVAAVIGFVLYDAAQESALAELRSGFQSLLAKSADPMAPRVWKGSPQGGDARDALLAALEKLSPNSILEIETFVARHSSATPPDSQDYLTFERWLAPTLEPIRRLQDAESLGPLFDVRQGATGINETVYVRLHVLGQGIMALGQHSLDRGLRQKAIQYGILALDLANGMVGGGSFAAFVPWRNLVSNAGYLLLGAGSGKRSLENRRAAAAALERCEANLPSFVDFLRGERWLWEYQAMSEAGGQGEGIPVRQTGFFDRSDLAERWGLMRRYYQDLETMSAGAAYDKRSELRALETKYRSQSAALPLLTPYWDEYWSAVTELRLLRVAHQLYAQATPALSLDGLSAKDPFGQGDLQLKRPEGQAHILYSVGRDGVDQGGKLVKDARGDFMLFTDAPGGDVVLPLDVEP